MAIAPHLANAQANCAGSLQSAFTAPSELNREGRTERPADLSVAKAVGSAGQPCFASGNSIRITYNAILTLPAVVNNATTNNYVLSDVNGTLVVNIGTTSGVGVNGPATVITIDVVTGTSDATASIVLKNLRFDATTRGDASELDAFVSSTNTLTPPAKTQLGTVRNTIGSGDSQPTLSTGTGIQSAGGPLTSQASFTINSNPAWAGTNPFRIAIPTPPIAGDTATTATTLTFDVENIPAGVTVTFPATLTTATNKWSAKSATLTATGGTLVVTYNTIANPGTGFTLNVNTGAAQADTGGSPTIGVQISTASGNGTATIRAVFGPGETSHSWAMM